MSDITVSIRLNDYMSSTLRTINTTLNRTITTLTMLQRQLTMVGSGHAFNPLGTEVSALMAQVQMLEAMIASIGTGAGPNTLLLGQLSAQLTAARTQAALLEAALHGLSASGQSTPQVQQLNTALTEARQRIQQLEGDLRHLGGNDPSGNTANSTKTMGFGELISNGKKMQEIFTKLQKVSVLAEPFIQANTQLNLINDGLRTQAKLQRQVMEMAHQTGTSYTVAAGLMNQIGRLPLFAGSNDKAVRFADSVNKSLALSGLAPTDAANTFSQLIQAMKSGAISGEAFNNILSDGGYLAQTLAQQLGTTIGGLQKMAAHGQLTADQVANALLSASEAIDKDFKTLPLTFGQSMTMIREEFSYWLAELSQADGALGRLNELFAQLAIWLQSDGGQNFLELIAYALNMLAAAAKMTILGLQPLGEILGALAPLAQLLFIAILVSGALLAAQAIGEVVLAIGAAVAGLAMAHPIMAAVAIIIAVLIMRAKELGLTMVDVVLTIVEAWYELVNIFEEIKLKIHTLFINIAIFISDILSNILLEMQRFINDFLSGVDVLIDAINKYTPFHMEHTTKWTFADDFNNRQNEKKNEWLQNLAQERLDIEQNRATQQNTLDALRITLEEKFGNGYDNSQYKTPFSWDSWTMPNIGSVDKVGRIGAIDTDVNIADEDMKMLMELAIQNRVNQINLTVQTTNSPNVTQNNVINTELDLQTAVNEITTSVYDANQVTVEQDY